MSTIALDAIRPAPGLWRNLPESVRALLLLALFTLATRGWIFGDPVVNIDEQFYLMVGNRMLHGSLPYVDIWDRKPIGLFLIYALACRVFANAVIGYQVMAAASVVLTAQVLFTMARRVTSFWPALAGAAAYPAWLLVFGGIGGQSPVFYNLPMALAAAWTMALVIRPDTARLSLPGCAIMVLAGVAMQIKYTAVFEGVFFGLTLLWLGWRRRNGLGLLAAKGLGWIACALLPTAAALAWYGANGHIAEFIQSNFMSVFGDDNPLLAPLGRLAALTFGVSPLLLCVGIVWRRRAGLAPGVNWLLGWAAGSYVGFLAYGVWNDHYVLPLLMPLCLLAGVAFGSVVRWRPLVALVAGLGLLGGTARAAVDVGINGNARELGQLSALVRANLGPAPGRNCLYVNEQLSILYMVTPGCLPSRYVFPQHLALECYHRALGIDQLAELRRVLASRPAVVVISTDPDPDTRADTRATLMAALRLGYRHVGTVTVGDTGYAVYAVN
ncbi:MAG: hypothetical protein KGN34_17875 [Sphingomonadales bacterium]|nr:hypothetical protein [Sphingomonadales bacterium]